MKISLLRRGLGIWGSGFSGFLKEAIILAYILGVCIYFYTSALATLVSIDLPLLLELIINLYSFDVDVWINVLRNTLRYLERNSGSFMTLTLKVKPWANALKFCWEIMASFSSFSPDFWRKQVIFFSLCLDLDFSETLVRG